jgi:glutathione synthase/RimK-type ligase-like ATP-grasp enzyme
MLEQEFVAATVGGVLKDIRITFTGNKVQYAYYRIAPRGTLYTNVHFGARMEFINLRDIAPLVRHARDVARPLAIFPKKIFCLDFLVDAKQRKPLLIESNSMPGMDGFTDAGYHRLLSDVTAHLLE